MAAQRKISVLKVLRFLCTLLGVGGFALAVMSATRHQAQESIRGVDIRVTNSDAVGFLNDQALQDLLFRRRNLSTHNLSYTSADIQRMEKIARSNPWIQDAQVYVDNQQILHVRATQRVPVVRVFESGGASYYLDTALQQLPLSPEYAHYTAVVTQVPHLTNDAAGRRLKGEMLYLVNKLARHPFWKQGVEEIVYREGGGYELIPVLGQHRAIIGDTSELDNKLQNLFLFYKNVLNRIGWDRYTVLDARFNNQVVASPSLPWKPPVDRALSNMNWVKTIVKEEITDTMTARLAAQAAAQKPDTTRRRMMSTVVPTPARPAPAASVQKQTTSATTARAKPATATTSSKAAKKTTDKPKASSTKKQTSTPAKPRNN